MPSRPSTRPRHAPTPPEATSGSVPTDAPAPLPPDSVTPLDRHAWVTPEQWRQGTFHGTAVSDDVAGPPLRLARPRGVTTVRDPRDGTDHRRAYARWLSPVHVLPFPATELVVSWNAATPPGTALRVEIRATYTDGRSSPWFTLALWAAHEGPPARGSVAGQRDGVSAVHTDTVTLTDHDAGVRLASYQCRLTLLRPEHDDVAPTVRRLDVLASAVPDRFEAPATEPGPGRGTALAVPAYAQTPHTGRYPEYNGGGEAWCSPTATHMVVTYWGGRTAPAATDWVDPSFDDPEICHAARATYDHTYGGCGNWPFNAAYAATYDGLQALVTRLATLTEAERLVAAGIPVIASQAFEAAELDGSGYDTAGHLLAVTGFTDAGDVVVHDPAAPDNGTVRRVYDRRQFERVWLRTRRRTASGGTASGTGGVCYLVFPRELSDDQRATLTALDIGLPPAR